MIRPVYIALALLASCLPTYVYLYLTLWLMRYVLCNCVRHCKLRFGSSKGGVRLHEKKGEENKTRQHQKICEGFALFVNEQFGRQLQEWKSDGLLQDQIPNGRGEGA
jgi:hypothetical protein